MKGKTKETFVWRLEDKNGDGIYRGDHPLGYSYVRQCTDIYKCFWVYEHRQPLPQEDDLEFVLDISNSRFGFATLEQYRKWFFRKSWRKGFSENGVLLNKYKVSEFHVKRGNSQVMFRKEYAELVETRIPAYNDL